MRRGVAVAVLLAAALVSAAATTAASTQPKPRLTLVATAPLTVIGTNFRSRERVRVIAIVGAERETRRTRASSSGTFRVAFSEAVRLDRCLGIFVSAVGSGGSRAALKLPQPACPPPLYRDRSSSAVIRRS